MDNATLLLALMTVILLGVAGHAWWLGNDRRDVALLGTFSGVCGVGAVAAAVL